jgi:hypothetical protein
MLLPILPAILAFYYFMRKQRHDGNDDDDDEATLLPGTRFDNWELAFGDH